jgi:hypothetical protein
MHDRKYIKECYYATIATDKINFIIICNQYGAYTGD